jgi:hypothetical protein
MMNHLQKGAIYEIAIGQDDQPAKGIVLTAYPLVVPLGRSPDRPRPDYLSLRRTHDGVHPWRCFPDPAARKNLPSV